MAKKRKPRKKGKRKKPVPLYFMTGTIQINENNVIGDPGPMSTMPGLPVGWSVVNNDSVRHVVSIDTRRIKHKNNNKFEHPFTSQRHLKTKPLGPGEQAPLWAAVRDKFKNKKEMYKYEIASTNASGPPTVLDPDLDVVEPNPRIFNPGGRPRKFAGPFRLTLKRYRLPGPAKKAGRRRRRRS